MGSRKMVVLQMDNGMMIDPGEMAQEPRAHSQRVAQGGLYDWTAVNDYLRGTPKPRNWKRLPELVLPMTTEVMWEAIRRSTMGGCSPRLDGLGKPLWHALAEYLVGPMTATMQWQLATGYIPRELEHGIQTHVPKKNMPPVVVNMRLLTMLKERAKIYSTASCGNRGYDAAASAAPGFMKQRHMMSHVASWLQRTENTQWEVERWFFRADQEKAYGMSLCWPG